MDFDKVWDFIKKESDFIKSISDAQHTVIDFDRGTYTRNGVWMIDPLYLLLSVFRFHFAANNSMPSNEFAAMNSLAMKSNIKLPISKREYDEYITYDMRNQKVLYVLEDKLQAENNKFTIPTKEYADSHFRGVSDTIESVMGGIFLYENREARYYIDLYDRLAGFEVFLENGSIFVPSGSGNIKKPTLYEERLRNMPIEGSTIEIVDMEYIWEVVGGEGTVFVSSDSVDSASSVAKYFRSFNIQSKSDMFLFRTLFVLHSEAQNPISTTLNGHNVIDFASSAILRRYHEGGASSVPEIIDIVTNLSPLQTAHKEAIMHEVKREIAADIYAMLIPYISGDMSSHESMVASLIGKRNIELSAKVIRPSGAPSSVIFYNKRAKYFKQFDMDKRGIINYLLPDVGGTRFIASYCGIDMSNVPSGHTIESYVLQLVTQYIHREFGQLPIYRGDRASGVHLISSTPIMGHSEGVHGIDGKHSIDGILIDDARVNVTIPTGQVTKKQAAAAVESVVEGARGFISIENKEYMLFGAMIASSIVSPLLARSNKFVATIVGANKYVEDGLNHKVFDGVFRNAIIVNTKSDYVVTRKLNGNSSIVVLSENKGTSKVIRDAARERFGTQVISRLKGSDTLITTMNLAPMVVYVDNEIIIDDSVVFNFRHRISNDHAARAYDYADVSGSIISYVFRNTKRLYALEDKFVAFAKNNMKSGKIIDKNSYYDFFEKILPAMCLVELVGYMDGVTFHDAMMSVFFKTNRIRRSLRVDKMLLKMEDGQHRVEDKVFDPYLRMGQEGDTVYVDKIFHRSYIDNSDSDTFVFMFDIAKVYNKLSGELDISLVEFHEALRLFDGYMSYDNAVKNWRMGQDKKQTVYAAYKDRIGGKKDNFCAIKIKRPAIFEL